MTADNAMSLCKAKTKVPGIGKGYVRFCYETFSSVGGMSLMNGRLLFSFLGRLRR